MVYCICVLSFGLLSDHEPCTTLKLLGMKNSSFIYNKQNYIIVSIHSYQTNLIRMVNTYIFSRTKNQRGLKTKISISIVT